MIMRTLHRRLFEEDNGVKPRRALWFSPFRGPCIAAKQCTSAFSSCREHAARGRASYRHLHWVSTMQSSSANQATRVASLEGCCKRQLYSSMCPSSAPKGLMVMVMTMTIKVMTTLVISRVCTDNGCAMVGGVYSVCAQFVHGHSRMINRASHPYYAGTKHIGFSPTRQAGKCDDGRWI